MIPEKETEKTLEWRVPEALTTWPLSQIWAE